ncbi:hypothetical protein B0H17DRAFT_1208000 [Mycena rosella]|uniref:Uncharacterized protein n=1 Tax=Mycena rosella TaxID=1033263 RepID=A0AAD7D1Z3_MYCRO|nr:hypothetical protein B0H17DRAFT_1208000 [Mycena rosella]
MSTVCCLALEIIPGTLAVLFTRLLHCAVLLTFIHLRPAVFQAVSDGILAAAALSTIPSMSTMFATASWFTYVVHVTLSYAPPRRLVRARPSSPGSAQEEAMVLGAPRLHDNPLPFTNSEHPRCDDQGAVD